MVTGQNGAYITDKEVTTYPHPKRFETTSSDSHYDWDLPPDMVEYVTKQFSDYVSEKYLK